MFSSNSSQVSSAVSYIEDVFSTYLYTGNGSTQTITNNIDLSTKGGLTWIKSRTNTSGGATSHVLVDTVRGSSKWLASDATSSETTNANLVTGFTTSGFSVGNAPYWGNENAIPYVSWTFREQAKFFDVVTYTGNGVANRAIPHNLGSAPGCIFVKPTSAVGDWIVYHRGLATPTSQALYLNTTDAAVGIPYFPTQPTSTNFYVAENGYDVNNTGVTYVAYLFAHDAGGFGLAGTDNVISCGSFTTDPSTGAATVSLGYEPQWLLVKASTMNQGWHLIDNMRGMVNVGTYGDAAFLEPNTSAAESTGANCYPTANGFYYGRSGSTTYIYIAIRRGPMKVPTLGTSVYMGATRTGNGAVTALTAAGFPPDLYWAKSRAAVRDHAIFDRLRGPLPLLSSNNTQNEIAYTDDLKSFDMTGVTTGTDGSTNAYNQNAVTYVNWYMRRAPSFFDEVCYTGTGVATTQTHNLGVVPELVIIKNRTSAYSWQVGALSRTFAKVLSLDQNSAEGSYSNVFNNTDPTASVFSVGTGITTNGNTNALVAYLFATCAGVSKVGSYTGNGTTQTIDCGFTGGARFVLIKRTDSTGDWYTYDTARGMTVLTDPYLLLNSTAAETATLGSVTTVSTGFALNSAILADINISAGTYIFLSVA